MQKFKLFFYVALSILVWAQSCRKNDTPPANNNAVVNDAVQVTASISGIITNENNLPIDGAVVKSGSSTTTTNVFGMFSFNNIPMSEQNATVTVTKAGYFKGTRTFKAKAGKMHQIKIHLMAKTLTGTVNGASGGTISGNGGSSIVFPANAFVTSGGAAYTGTVNVYSRWIDPTAANLSSITPGDLRGVNTGGAEQVLATYGMLGAELEDAAGNALKIAPNKTATINGIIPTSLLASAPATIPLWHFDEATARWKEEGTATKTGNSYVAQVSRFSFWNYDVPSDFILLDLTLINAATGLPLNGVEVRIKRISNGSSASGYTNGSGFVSGAVPKNQALALEVINGGCGISYTQNIGPFASNTNLGSINVTVPASNIGTISGVLKNCSGTAVTNGTVEIYLAGGIAMSVPVNSSTGAFNATYVKCSGATTNYSLVGIDNSTNQQSLAMSGSSAAAVINVGNVSACGTSADQYINVVIDGVAINFTSPSDIFGADQQPLSGGGFSYEIDLGAAKNNGASNQQTVACIIRNNNNSSTGQLNQFIYEPNPNGVQELASGPSNVTFSNFSNTVGGFVIGSFNCVTTGPNPKNVTCSFKVRRSN